MTVSTAPKYSPWGRVQRVYVLADGVQFVSTASHGGIKLNRKRNAEMPAALRRKGGWYEEDVEQALVLVGLPNLFRPEQVDEARKTVKNWFPDEYEAWTGETLTTEESFVKAERQFAIDNSDNYVVVAAWGDWRTKVPKGMVGVAATKGGNRNNDLKWFLVSSEEYKGRSRFGFVIDENRHQPTDPISF